MDSETIYFLCISVKTPILYHYVDKMTRRPLEEMTADTVMELQNFLTVCFWLDNNTKRRAGSQVNDCTPHRRDALWDFFSLRQTLSDEKLHFGSPRKWDALVRRLTTGRAGAHAKCYKLVSAIQVRVMKKRSPPIVTEG